MLTASVYVCVQILIEELEEYEVSLGTPLYRCVYFFLLMPHIWSLFILHLYVVLRLHCDKERGFDTAPE